MISTRGGFFVKKLFVIGDVHGEFDLLEALLKHWDKESQQLVFLGDLADRGPKSKECFEKVMALVENEGAICITGNHEDMILRWLDSPEEKMDWYLRNGAKETFESLFYQGILDEKSPDEIAELFRSEYGDLLDFITNLPVYYEHDYAICVHAGFDLTLENYRETERYDAIWIREAFYESDLVPDKLIVHGHSPVTSIRQDKLQTQVIYKNNKLNIDGGAVYEGSLHGVVIGKNGLEADYQIFHPNYLKQDLS